MKTAINNTAVNYKLIGIFTWLSNNNIWLNKISNKPRKKLKIK